MDDEKIVNLDLLKNLPAGIITVNGNAHLVVSPNFRQIKSVRQPDPDTRVSRLRAAVGECVASLAGAELEGLSARELAEIWAIICGGFDAARSMTPNIYGPGGPGSLPFNQP